MKLRLFLLIAALVLLFAPLTHAQTQSFCNSTIIDQAGLVHSPQVIGDAARTLISQGADVKVVIVDSVRRYGSSLSDAERYFETNCPNWTSNGQRKANLFVVMVAPNDRAKNMFLGSYYSGAFDIPSTYSQLSNTYFKNRQWELGLAAVLQGTTGQALSYRTSQVRSAPAQPRTYTASGAQAATPTQQADTGMSNLAIFFLVLLGFAVIGGIVYLIYRANTATETTATDYDTTPAPDRTYTTPNPYRARSYAAAAPSSTTVINNSGGGDGFVSGMVVGEMLSRPNNPTVVYEQPQTPSYISEPTPLPTATDSPDSTWEAPQQPQPDTSFSPEPDPTPDTSFSDSSSSDSSFGSSDSGSSSDSSF